MVGGNHTHYASQGHNHMNTALRPNLTRDNGCNVRGWRRISIVGAGALEAAVDKAANRFDKASVAESPPPPLDELYNTTNISK